MYRGETQSFFLFSIKKVHESVVWIKRERKKEEGTEVAEREWKKKKYSGWIKRRVKRIKWCKKIGSMFESRRKKYFHLTLSLLWVTKSGDYRPLLFLSRGFKCKRGKISFQPDSPSTFIGKKLSFIDDFFQQERKENLSWVDPGTKLRFVHRKPIIIY